MPELLISKEKLKSSPPLYTKEQIYSKFLPHGYEFQVLDSVTHVDEAAQEIVGVKHVRPDEFWVRGHVPGNPIFPGVLAVEAAAQLCAILYKCCVPNVAGKFVAFGGLDSVRFRKSAFPGQTIIFVGKGKQVSSIACKCLAQAIVDDHIIFSGEILGIPMSLTK